MVIPLKINQGTLEDKLNLETEKAIFDYQKQKRLIIEHEKKSKIHRIIVESLLFNNKFIWETKNNCNLVKTPKQMLEIMQLRKKVYSNAGYGLEFPEIVQDLLFDDFDKNSAIFFYNRTGFGVSGSIRIVVDCGILPSEEKYSFENLRTNYLFGELSRQVIDTKFQSSGIEFRNFYNNIHSFSTLNNFNFFIACIEEDHLKLYQKFGGISILDELENYGSIEKKFYILKWNPSEISPFFKRAFLKN